MPPICNFEGCSVELKEKSLCVYCADCLPKFLEIFYQNKRQDAEERLQLEKDSIQVRKKWLNDIEDVNYRDKMKKNFKYYKYPKYKELFQSR